MKQARVPAERASCAFEDHSKEQFALPASAFNNQFANMYFTRLNDLRPMAEAAAVAKWGAAVMKTKVNTLDAEPDVPVLIIGTLYKDMTGKPNILEEVTRDVLAKRLDAAGVTKYCGEGDSLVLEDASGRVPLILPPALAAASAASLVTGVVLAARGTLNGDGELLVEELCLPGPPPQAALAPPKKGGKQGARYVALVSGLHVGHGMQDMLPLQLLAEHLTGQLGCAEDHRAQANIVRLVVAGNATCAADDAAGAGGAGEASHEFMKKVATAESQKALTDSVRTLDQFLTAISSSMPVDLMPGSDDPCNRLLPQQPFHPCMLPHSSQLATLNLTSNPYCADVDGVRFLGTSGQPIDDAAKYSPDGAASRIATLEATLNARHLAPTAPDTLGCYPFIDRDPFMIRECPHVYFAGNQPAYESKLVEGAGGQRVRVVCVPDFALEHTCVLVDLETLETQAVKFSGLKMPMES